MAEKDVNAQKGWNCNKMVTMTTVVDDIYRGVMMTHSLNQRD